MRLYREVVVRALGSLVAHRFRAALTLLGIAWGIVTVVLLMAYGAGFHRALMYGFRNAFSQGTILVSGGQTSLQAVRHQYWEQPLLTTGESSISSAETARAG